MVDAPDTLRDLRRDLAAAFRVMDEREDDYVRGRDYYDGDRPEVHASRYMQRLVSRSAQSIPISLAHIPVDAVVEKVQLAGVTAADRAADALLEQVVEANDLAEEVDDWVLRAGYFGDYYVVIDPATEDDAGRVTAEDLRWVGSSPLSTVMVYDRADERTALYGAKVWAAGKGWRARLFYDDCTVKLTVVNGRREADRFDFDTDTGDDGDAFIFHPGERMLLVHLAIGGRPYGVPLHRKAWGPQDALTKISASNLATIEGVALPSRWAILDPQAEVDDDMDDDFGTNSGDTTGAGDGLTAATTGQSRVRDEPGGVAYLRGVKAVGTFESGDKGGLFLKNAEWYIRVMAVACGVPLFEFDLSGEQPSGESRRRASARAILRAQRVQRSTAAALTRLADTTLAVLGTSSVVTVAFQPSETATDKDGLELVAAKVRAGVPVAVALAEAGYPADTVAEWWPDDRPAVTPDLLQVLATALQQLGQAKTLGVVTDEELRDMLPTVLTGARGEGEAAPVDEGPLPGVVIDPATQLAEQMKVKGDALGSFIRSGADPLEAVIAIESGDMSGLTFPNVPVTVRIPESEADGLEGGAPAAPQAPVVG